MTRNGEHVHLITTASSADEHNRRASVAVLPIGAFEQHGDVLPLTTDTVIACLIARRIATDYNLFLLPPITISCSHEHEDFPGTVSLSASTLISTITDIRNSLARTGIDKLVLVNGHGGNYVLSNIAQEANTQRRCLTLFPGRADWETARTHAGLTTSASEDMHGGEQETSLLLHAHPELVGDAYAERDHHAPHRPHLLITGIRGYSTTGIIGRPSQATAEKGAAILDSLTTSFADHLQILTACASEGTTEER
jgi:creatinine amidohydrolase